MVEEKVDPETFVRQLEAEAIRPEDSTYQVASHARKRSEATSLSDSVLLKQLEEAATQASLETKAKRLREKPDTERKLAELQRQKC